MVLLNEPGIVQKDGFLLPLLVVTLLPSLHSCSRRDVTCLHRDGCSELAHPAELPDGSANLTRSALKHLP